MVPVPFVDKVKNKPVSGPRAARALGFSGPEELLRFIVLTQEQEQERGQGHQIQVLGDPKSDRWHLSLESVCHLRRLKKRLLVDAAEIHGDIVYLTPDAWHAFVGEAQKMRAPHGAHIALYRRGGAVASANTPYFACRADLPVLRQLYLAP
jgi:uncharacterized protein YjiS (DUF1127 family)